MLCIEVLSQVIAQVLYYGCLLALAPDLGFRHVCFETDRFTLFEAWKRPPSDSSYFATIVSDCCDLVSNLMFLISLMFIELISIVAFLAKIFFYMGFFVWLAEAPDGALHLLQTDVLALARVSTAHYVFKKKIFGDTKYFIASSHDS